MRSRGLKVLATCGRSHPQLAQHDLTISRQSDAKGPTRTTFASLRTALVPRSGEAARAEQVSIYTGINGCARSRSAGIFGAKSPPRFGVAALG